MIQIIYPADDFDIKTIDDHYQAEANLARHLGFEIGIIDLNSFKFEEKGLSLVNKEIPSIYRGWMLNENQYKNLSKKINLSISPDTYLYSHHINNWYNDFKEYTIPTTIIESKENIPEFNKALFIKDYVKSNTGKLGSIAFNKIEALSILDELEKYRGEIEGGICLRDFITIDKNTEKRYFIFHNTVFSNELEYPSLLNNIAEKLPYNNFSSVDIAFTNGKPILIEIGDGQVSDIKEWKLDSFSKVLSSFKSLELKNKIKP